jgi:hypothetical protein
MSYARYDTPLGLAGFSVGDNCPVPGCGIPIDRGTLCLCGDTPGQLSEHGCGRWFCGYHLYTPPPGVELHVGAGLCPSCYAKALPLGELVVRGCTACPRIPTLCRHELGVLPLAAALAQHFDPIASAADPLAGAFLPDALYLAERIGRQPYHARPLYPEDLPDGSPCRRGVAINGWMIGYLPGSAVDTVAVVLAPPATS